MARGQGVGNGIKMADENTYISSALIIHLHHHVECTAYGSGDRDTRGVRGR